MCALYEITTVFPHGDLLWFSSISSWEPPMKRAAIYLRVSTLDQTTANQEASYARLPAAAGSRSSRSIRITGSLALRAETSARSLMPY